MTLPSGILTRIEEIRADKTTGAETLMQKASNLFLYMADHVQAKDCAELSKTLEETARTLVNAQPAMVGIFNLVNKILLTTGSVASVKEMKDAMIETAIATVRSSDMSLQSIANTAAELFKPGQVVATHSFSSTVFHCLLEAKKLGVEFTVLCTESRPMMEGVTLAGQLAGAGIKVRLTTDAALFSQLKHVNLVLLGVDSIGVEGMVGKTGTMAIALVARQFQIKCYALCSSHKYVPPGHKLATDIEGDHKEILAEASSNVTPVNPYFDLTPLEYLTGVITERGVLSIEAVKKDIRDLKIHPLLR